MSYQPKIALVHDDFMQNGGAENLFGDIASLYKSAPIYTSIVNYNKLPNVINKIRLRISFLQKIPFAKQLYKAFLPFYPIAFENFNFDNFGLVISSTTRFAKCVVTKPETIHICYINSVPRFLWHQGSTNQYYSPKISFLLKPVLFWLKRMDKAASSRVDHYIANSQNVAKAVKKYYNREAKVIYPFADLSFFKPATIHNWSLKSQDYFLIVSRLVKWKQIDKAIKACNAKNVNLIIVGSGPQEKDLKKIAGKTIKFYGKVDREILRNLYQNSKGLIVTQEEDFGISIVEAQACGIPVIAYSTGGQKEIIKDGETGLFFTSQQKEAIEDAITAASNVKWDEAACRKNALRFSQGRFEKEIKQTVAAYAKAPSRS